MTLLDTLWERYAAHVPYARAFVQLAGGDFRNDHVAFRSLDLEPIARVFESLGWKRAGNYDLADVHLTAIHLSKPGEPRVFVSELRVGELSKRAQEILRTVPPAPAPGRDLANWFSAPEERPSERDLLEIEIESQYGAWLLLFGREVKHFTASVDDVETWQRRGRRRVLRDIETIALGRAIRELARLRKFHGRGRWRKMKGIATIRFANESIREAELHWYEAHGIGRKEFKIKRLLPTP